ncbi:MAG: PorV/PorQ family protein [Chitinophagaceae bacterium]
MRSNIQRNYQISISNNPYLLALDFRFISFVKSLFAILLIAYSLEGNGQFRKYSNEFMNIGAGARGLAMGGAQIATTEDSYAGFWNPAGLSELRGHSSYSLMHAEYFAGIGKYDYFSAASPIGDPARATMGLGISLLRFAVDDIPNTLFLVEPDGTINYNNIRSFSSADYALLISYGQTLYSDSKQNFSFGTNAKVIHRSVGEFAKAWGVGLDAALQYRSKKISFGLVVRDITSTYNAWRFSFTEKEKEVLYLTNNDIPVKSVELTAPRLYLGVAYNTDLNEKFSFLGEMNFEMSFDGKRNVLLSSKYLNMDPRIGVELNYAKTVAFRMGIYNFQKGLKDGDTTNFSKVWIYQPGVGVGFNIKQFRIDYAFTNLANQSNPLYTHVFSLHLRMPTKKYIY